MLAGMLNKSLYMHVCGDLRVDPKHKLKHLHGGMDTLRPQPYCKLCMVVLLQRVANLTDDMETGGHAGKVLALRGRVK